MARLGAAVEDAVPRPSPTQTSRSPAWQPAATGAGGPRSPLGAGSRGPVPAKRETSYRCHRRTIPPVPGPGAPWGDGEPPAPPTAAVRGEGRGQAGREGCDAGGAQGIVGVRRQPVEPFPLAPRAERSGGSGGGGGGGGRAGGQRGRRRPTGDILPPEAAL